jgi:chromosome segregation ATPase
MAGFNLDTQSSVYTQIQEIISKYISNLEFAKMEESKRLCQLAEEAKNIKIKIDNDVKKASEELSSINRNKERELEDKETFLLNKNQEFLSITKEIEEKKKELNELNMDKELSFIELNKHKDEIYTLSSQQERLSNEIGLLNSNIQSGNLKLNEIQNKFNELTEKSNELNKFVESNDTLFHRLSDDSSKLMGEIDELKKSKSLMEASVGTTKKELDVFLAEIDIKKKIAKNELDKVEKLVQENNTNISEERKTIEKEILFLQQMKEINLQKNKNFIYIKEKLQEIITKLVLEVDETKAVEFKTLLSVVNKL